MVKNAYSSWIFKGGDVDFFIFSKYMLVPNMHCNPQPLPTTTITIPVFAPKKKYWT